MVGYFAFSTPQLLINDLDLAKLILIKDFDTFIDRRQFPFNEVNGITSCLSTILLSSETKF